MSRKSGSAPIPAIPTRMATGLRISRRGAPIARRDGSKPRPDPKSADNDGDGLKDGEEVNKYHNAPNNKDTDNDKLGAGVEVLKVKTAPLNPETDGDTVIDGDDQCPLIKGV